MNLRRKFNGAKHGTEAADVRCQGTGYRYQETGLRVQEAGFRMQVSGIGIGYRQAATRVKT
jgi:hypothetical protein